ncbi:N-acetyltransferase NAT13 [Auriscalpium vulgare]|uniref:N-acetyltransferase NAT13 n=1 Tax=Auriscalpium vulgare TaxID=40419 RepID=A0ACB8S661_9AGAM|nr:N-acetyltransferase NAT13 [Auriscalpium vulgare]
MSPVPKSRSTRVAFASLTQNNLGTVRKLNSVLFPIKYSDKLYSEILQPEVEDFCKLIYYNDIPVGIICCRLETKDGVTQLYLLTMGILAPYRSLGIGSHSLQLVLDAAAAHTKPALSRIYLHVQVSNDPAKRFYERNGFKEIGIDETYYKKIKPSGAWILEKTFAPPGSN